MAEYNYAPPVDQLLRLGEPTQQDWAWYLTLGIGREHASDLLRMVADEELNEAPGDSPEVWAPVHAWRALAALHVAEVMEPLLLMLDEPDPDDWAMNDLPDVAARVGPPAVPILARYLAAPPHTGWFSNSAADSLGKIGARHPEAREECIAVVADQLEQFEENDGDFNGFLLAALMDLKAVEQLPLIERAFAADAIDPMIAGDWNDVQVEFGLKPPPKRTVPFWLREAHGARPSAPVDEAAVWQKRVQDRRAKEKAKRKQQKALRKKQRKRGK